RRPSQRLPDSRLVHVEVALDLLEHVLGELVARTEALERLALSLDRRPAQPAEAPGLVALVRRVGQRARVAGEPRLVDRAEAVDRVLRQLVLRRELLDARERGVRDRRPRLDQLALPLALAVEAEPPHDPPKREA